VAAADLPHGRTGARVHHLLQCGSDASNLPIQITRHPS
jgi:hypothetical protein